MGRRRVIERRGVTVRDLGSRRTRNGISWAAEVSVSGMRFRLENDGNGGMTTWDRWDEGFHMNEGVRAAQTEIAALARMEPALAEYVDATDCDSEAAGMFVSAVLDGAFLVVQA